MTIITEAEHWRMKAGALRAVADDVRKSDARHFLFDLAIDLEGIARRLEGGAIEALETLERAVALEEAATPLIDESDTAAAPA